MPLRCADHSSGPKASLAVAGCLVAACAAVVLAGCGPTAASVRLPLSRSAALGRPGALAAPASRLARFGRQPVIAAFTGYNAALRTAGNSGSAAEVRLLLRPYLDSATIANLVRFDRGLWSEHEIFYGHVVYHILTVRVDGDHAFVHDCDNTSGSGLENATTGQLIPGSLGVKYQNIVTRLNFVGGRWLIGLQTIEDVPCKP